MKYTYLVSYVVEAKTTPPQFVFGSRTVEQDGEIKNSEGLYALVDFLEELIGKELGIPVKIIPLNLVKL